MSKKRLLNEFSFGFELEGTYDHSATNYHYLKDKFDEMLHGEGNMHGDGSLRAEPGYSTFEYASPVIQFTPKNIQMVVKFFDALPSMYVKINRTCGLHTHISYKGINRQDISWLMASMASDQSYRDFLKMGRTNFYKGPYARANFFGEAHSSLEHNNLSHFCNIIVTNEKYRSMRIHPQGTLEWRGPRTFLNAIKHSKNVAFMKKLTQLIIKINNTLDLTETPLLSKEKFLNNAANYINNLTFRDDTVHTDKMRLLFQRIVEKPEVISRLRDDKFNEFMDWLRGSGASMSSILETIRQRDDFEINDVRTLKFFYTTCQIRSFIKYVNPTLFKENLDKVGDWGKLTPTFEFLIKNENVNDEILYTLTREALVNFGKSSIKTFTFNAMREMIKYNINALKAAVSKNLVSLLGEARARDLIQRAIQQDQYGFKNSELYNALMDSPNRDLVVNCFPQVNTLDNRVVDRTVNEVFNF